LTFTDIVVIYQHATELKCLTDTEVPNKITEWRKKMKKTIALLLAVVLVLSLCACGSKAEKTDYENLKAKGTIIVGITDFAPMDYRDADNNWTGFDAELAEKVAADLGLKVEFMEIEWDNKVLELNAGTIDCVWNGMTLTEEVKSAMSCSKPYVLNAQVVVVKADVADRYTTVESLAGLTLSVEAGSAGAMAAADCELATMEVGSQANALMEVAAGTSQGCVIDATMAAAMTGEGTSYADLVVCCELTNEEYGIGFRTGSDMTAKVDELLDKYKADGSLQALADKYGLSLCQ